MAQRMRLLRPVITGSSSVEITVSSPQIINELNDLKVNMENFLRPRLQNSELSFTFQLAEQEVVRRSFNKKEQLLEMEKRNPAIASLIKELQLEFD